MNIQRLKKLNKVLLSVSTIFILSCSHCKVNKRITSVFNCVVIDNGSYVYSDEAILRINGESYSLREKADYQTDGRIFSLTVFKPEGALVYSLNDILSDTAILENYGFPIQQNWFYKGGEILYQKNKVFKVEVVNDSLLKLSEGHNIVFYKTE